LDEENDYQQKHKALTDRLSRLRETKNNQLKKTCDDYRLYNKTKNEEKFVTDDDVIDELKLMWQIKKQNDIEIQSIKKDIKQCEKEILSVRKDVKYWKEFKMNGQHHLDTQIKLLKQELIDMKQNFEIISAKIAENIDVTIDKIQKNTDETIDRKNKTAAEVKHLIYNNLDSQFLN
jgi:hypothetical protein